MKIAIHVIIISLLITAPVYAKDTDIDEKYPIQYEVSPNSNLKGKKVDSKVWYMINFDGDIQFDAKYLVEYDDSRKTKLVVVLKPIHSLDNLIKFTDRGTRTQIKEFYVGEDATSIERLIGKENYLNMTTGKIKKMSGFAKFKIDGFSTYYECDELVYTAGINSIISTQSIAKIESVDSISGC